MDEALKAIAVVEALGRAFGVDRPRNMPVGEYAQNLETKLFMELKNHPKFGKNLQHFCNHSRFMNGHSTCEPNINGTAITDSCSSLLTEPPKKKRKKAESADTGANANAVDINAKDTKHLSLPAIDTDGDAAKVQLHSLKAPPPPVFTAIHDNNCKKNNQQQLPFQFIPSNSNSLMFINNANQNNFMPTFLNSGQFPCIATNAVRLNHSPTRNVSLANIPHAPPPLPKLNATFNSTLMQNGSESNHQSSGLLPNFPFGNILNNSGMQRNEISSGNSSAVYILPQIADKNINGNNSRINMVNSGVQRDGEVGNLGINLLLKAAEQLQEKDSSVKKSKKVAKK